MIELRWLIRKVPSLHGIDDGMFSPLPVMVDAPCLQYREWPLGCYPADNSGTQSIEPAWVDVPVVREP